MCTAGAQAARCVDTTKRQSLRRLNRPLGLRGLTMQTFLPLPSYKASAEVLDDKRLGKQRVETFQIARTLTGVSAGWKNHPAVKMWRGYESSLISYGMFVCDEWIRRGFNDTVLEKLNQLYLDHYAGTPLVTPAWLGDEAFHASHRSNLLRKSPDHYKAFGWSEDSDLPYIWPQGKES